MSYKIKYINLQAQHNSIKKEIKKKIESIFSRSAFILRQEVIDFEKKITKLLKIKYCVALNSGTDALLMSLSQIKIKKGDEIIVPSHTYVASVGAIKHIGAEPVFIDIRDDFNLDPNEIVKKISKKTRAIMVVHLNGRCCEMDKIMSIARKYKLKVIEDCAQAFGSKYKNKNAGSFGLSGAFSLHPMKNLNVPGDGGFLITNNKKVYSNVLLLRDHGRERKNGKEIRKSYGLNSRLDNLHAGIALIKLKYFKKWVNKRRSIAKQYCFNLSDLKNYIKLPIYKTSGSSGMDLMAFLKDPVNVKVNTSSIIPTGLSIACSENYEIQIRPRSGLAAKNNIGVLNSPGTIDSDYRGEIKVIIFNHGNKDFIVNNGDRIAQMVIAPIEKMELEETKSLPETIRGEGGFGSTGK